MAEIFFDDITLRAAGPDDAELIADLSRSTFFDTFYAHNDPRNMNIFLREQFTRKTLMDEVSHACNRFVLAYSGNEVAGYMKLRENNRPPELSTGNTLEIARLYATSKMIGKGVGKMLMQYAHDIARTGGQDSIWLAVWEKNNRALQFYRNWGFEIVGKQIFVLGMDLQTDWIMEKKI